LLFLLNAFPLVVGRLRSHQTAMRHEYTPAHVATIASLGVPALTVRQPSMNVLSPPAALMQKER
jgi:hypothetical protein